MKPEELIKMLPNFQEIGPRQRYIGWGPFDDGMSEEGRWVEAIEYESWDHFRKEFLEDDPSFDYSDLNQIFDFYFNWFPERPDKLELCLWLGYPRKGCTRGILINHVPEDKLPDVKKFLLHSHRRHMDCFRWVFENGDE